MSKTLIGSKSTKAVILCMVAGLLSMGCLLIDEGSDPASDVTQPFVVITNPGAGSTVNGTEIITFTDDELTAPQVSVDETNWTNAVSGTTKISDIAEFSGLTEGPTASFILYLKDTDAAGNTGTDFISLTKDTTVPTVTFTSTPAINSTNEASYTVSGSCSEDGEIVSVSIGGITDTPTCSISNTFTTTNDVSSLTGTSVTITADHTDAVGNSAIQASATVGRDLVAPTVSLNALSAITTANAGAYTVSGACSENGQVVDVIIGTVTATPAPTCSGGAFTTTNDVSSLTGTSVTITADHTDAVGNNATQASTPVACDLVAPTVSLNTLSAINASNQTTYTVSGACSENGQVVDVIIGTVTATPALTCSGGAFTTTNDVSALTSTSIIITADHADAAANSATQASTTVARDLVAPTVSLNALSAITTTNVGTYTVSGACSENGQVVDVIIGTVTATPAPTCSGGTFTVSSNVSAISDGASISITADHADAAGNSAAQASTTVLKDATAPVVNDITPTDNSGITAGSVDIVIVFNESVSTDALNLTLGGDLGSIATPAWSTTTVANDTLTLSSSDWGSGPAGIGMLTLTIDAKDAAGNIVSITLSYDIS